MPDHHHPGSSRGSDDGRFVIGRDGGLRAVVADHGATLVELHVPDRDGHVDDVVLGFDDVSGYTSPANPYFGATVGRVANRIAHASFVLDGHGYELAANEGPHHLHGGGAQAFSNLRWELVDHTPEQVRLRHVSPADAEGYPGRVEVSATYRVIGDALSIVYRATTDAPTPLDLTNHAYFNLRGHGDGEVLDHELTVLADHVLEVDEALIPTGALREVTATPLDLRTPTVLRGPVAEFATTPALGIDHHLVLRRDPDAATDAATAADADAVEPGGAEPGPGGRVRPVAWLSEPTTGRRLELATDQPGLQVYTGNRLEPAITGKGGRRYGRHGGICLEAHHLPDAVHHPGFPSIVLTPHRTYQHTTVLRFSAS